MEHSIITAQISVFVFATILKRCKYWKRINILTSIIALDYYDCSLNTKMSGVVCINLIHLWEIGTLLFLSWKNKLNTFVCFCNTEELVFSWTLCIVRLTRRFCIRSLLILLLWEFISLELMEKFHYFFFSSCNKEKKIIKQNLCITSCPYP